MRTLIPTVSDDVDLAEAYPWPTDTAWTRVVMLRGLDGGVAGADGRSRSISSDVDRELLGEARRLADAIVVGASTMREEPYGPVTSKDPEARAALGLAEAPVLVLVSGSLDLPWDEPVFTESTLRPIVVTTSDAPAERRERAAEVADVLELPAGEAGVDAAALVEALHERGLRRLLCEGGPGLLAAFTAADLVDEIDLTVAPSSPTRVVPSEAGAASYAFALEGLLEHDSFLFARYLRQR